MSFAFRVSAQCCSNINCASQSTTNKNSAEATDVMNNVAFPASSHVIKKEEHVRIDALSKR